MSDTKEKPKKIKDQKKKGKAHKSRKIGKCPKKKYEIEKRKKIANRGLIERKNFY